MKTKEIKRRLRPFRPEKTVEQLAKEQGVGRKRWEEICGIGAKLWPSDKELEAFLREVRERRHKGK